MTNKTASQQTGVEFLDLIIRPLFCLCGAHLPAEASAQAGRQA
jgi:hypothetical protein